ncbi:isoprenoid synthase domain-containing protein [Gorgonomyces haynaldii]|nr:isoprenoid synthase domain-containing protein [Gorgonomyces haynaldii]
MRLLHTTARHCYPLEYLQSKWSSFTGLKKPLNWNQVIRESEKLVQVGGSVINPKEILGKDLSLLKDNISKLLGTGHPVLGTISNYYFSQKGKHVRPLIVLLMAQATQSLSKKTSGEIDAPLSKEGTIVQFDQSPQESSVLLSQRRLAEITEMIHTASLLHDDVIDVSMTRRNAPTANAEFGNKMAILAGDFLLARASVALARLRNVQVVELLATVISDLVEGEFMQLRNSAVQGSTVNWSQKDRFEYYMEKTYLKTASLMAKSCQASVVLGSCNAQVEKAAYEFGKNLVDDLLDFVVTSDQFGKPANADLALGLATAPVLFAAEKYPELYPLMERKFSDPGDCQKARDLVLSSEGIQKTRELAQYYCDTAIQSISILPETLARTALENLCNAVLTRTK